MKSTRQPFQDQVDTALFFGGGSRREIVENIKTALIDEVPLITLTGTDGSGKTMICRMVEKELQDDMELLFFDQGVESFDNVVNRITEQVNLEESEEISDRKVRLEQAVEILNQSDRRLVLLIDCAETIFLATLERVRRMLDEVNTERLCLQILFSGRPLISLNYKQLGIISFEMIEEKHFSLDPLDGEDTLDYLNHCLDRAEGQEQNRFRPAQAEKIAEAARGNFRLINQLAEKYLTSKHPANPDESIIDDLYQDDSGLGGSDSLAKISSGLKSVDLDFLKIPRLGVRWYAFGASIIALILLFLLFSGGDEEEAEPLSDTASVPELTLEKVEPDPIEIPQPSTPVEPLKKIAPTEIPKEVELPAVEKEPDTIDISQPPGPVELPAEIAPAEIPEEAVPAVAEKEPDAMDIAQPPGPVELPAEIAPTEIPEEAVPEVAEKDPETIDIRQSSAPVEPPAHTVPAEISKKAGASVAEKEVDSVVDKQEEVPENSVAETTAEMKPLPSAAPDTSLQPIEPLSPSSSKQAEIELAEQPGQAEEEKLETEVETISAVEPALENEQVVGTDIVESPPAVAKQVEPQPASVPESEEKSEAIAAAPTDEQLEIVEDTVDAGSQQIPKLTVLMRKRPSTESVPVNVVTLKEESKKKPEAVLLPEVTEPEVVTPEPVRETAVRQQSPNAGEKQNVPEIAMQEPEPAVPALITVSETTDETTSEFTTETVALAPSPQTSVPDRNPEVYYAERLAAGSRWLVGGSRTKYTVQLMVLNSDDSQENVRKMLLEDGFQPIIDKLYILRKSGQPQTVMLYYGEFDSQAEARQARTQLPSFLSRLNPYEIAVKEAVAKARSGR